MEPLPFQAPPQPRGMGMCESLFKPSYGGVKKWKLLMGGILLAFFMTTASFANMKRQVRAKLTVKADHRNAQIRQMIRDKQRKRQFRVGT